MLTQGMLYRETGTTWGQKLLLGLNGLASNSLHPLKLYSIMHTLLVLYI